MSNVLEVKNLEISVPSHQGKSTAVRGVTFNIPSGRKIALVGESGSGKSLTAYAIMRLLKEPVTIDCGEIWLDQQNILSLGDKEFRLIRGGKIAMVYQDPMSALNPIIRIGKQLVESVRIHSEVSSHTAKNIVIDLLRSVGINEPEKNFNSYPFEMSGGMLQRVVIAMALSGNPKVLIADEATTALDVTTQARVLNLINTLAQDRGLSVLLITHDLGVAAQFADEIMVMYAGKIVEKGDIQKIYSRPLHPYTRALLDSRCDYTMDFDKPIRSISGQPPRPEDLTDGCAFAPRCAYAIETCTLADPPLVELQGVYTACFRAEELLKSNAAN
jgi:oligopeptide/dipeptide ABC transporter ATP-binding protein